MRAVTTEKMKDEKRDAEEIDRFLLCQWFGQLTVVTEHFSCSHT